MNDNYLSSIQKQLIYIRELGWKTIQQLASDKLNWQYNEESNSITQIVKHLSSNMLSRWTDFLNTDGEKEWRHRDQEFETENLNFEQIEILWNKGWDCLQGTISSLQAEDLERIVYIRNQGHTVVEAINRQLSHYSYHIGQIVYLGKMIQDGHWKSLSIPRGKSESYNKDMFAKEKESVHFTKNLLSKNKNQS